VCDPHVLPSFCSQRHPVFPSLSISILNPLLPEIAHYRYLSLSSSHPTTALFPSPHPGRLPFLFFSQPPRISMPVMQSSTRSYYQFEYYTSLFLPFPGSIAPPHHSLSGHYCSFPWLFSYLGTIAFFPHYSLTRTLSFFMTPLSGHYCLSLLLYLDTIVLHYSSIVLHYSSTWTLLSFITPLLLDTIVLHYSSTRTLLSFLVIPLSGHYCLFLLFPLIWVLMLPLCGIAALLSFPTWVRLPLCLPYLGHAPLLNFIIPLSKYHYSFYIRKTVDTYIGQIGLYRYYRFIGTPLLYTLP
jgi:hypothetical protein